MRIFTVWLEVVSLFFQSFFWSATLKKLIDVEIMFTQKVILHFISNLKEAFLKG